ncbi:MAG: PilZ domain-containing protein [Myxococcota bacterium]
MNIRRRRICRRALRAQCQAVALDGFRLLGEQLLDVSPYGMLVAADAEATVGEDVVVSFEARGEWYGAVAKVARIVEGWRPWDPGYCVALRFTDISLQERLDLATRLRGLPPPIPTRTLRALH